MKRAIDCLTANFSSTVAMSAPPKVTYSDFLSGSQKRIVEEFNQSPG
ncbi:MAG TPA: hypothetical protein VK768_02095 [Chthoniobacterales bacterium]|nr:hypothetical protein [Chthoniobacterales bacterium]